MIEVRGHRWTVWLSSATSYPVLLKCSLDARSPTRLIRTWQLCLSKVSSRGPVTSLINTSDQQCPSLMARWLIRAQKPFPNIEGLLQRNPAHLIALNQRVRDIFSSQNTRTPQCVTRHDLGAIVVHLCGVGRRRRNSSNQRVRPKASGNRRTLCWNFLFVVVCQEAQRDHEESRGEGLRGSKRS